MSGCPALYNSTMESNYWHLYFDYLKIKKYKSRIQNPNKLLSKIHKKPITQKDIDSLIIRFELEYHKISKMNHILNKTSKETKTFFPYLEPTSIKKRVDAAEIELGITPYKKLSEKDKEFIFV